VQCTENVPVFPSTASLRESARTIERERRTGPFL